MKDTKLIGDITELEILAYITKLGYQVSVPFGDRAKYDQVWDIEGNLIRVQVKTAKLHKSGDYLIICCKSTTRRKGKSVSVSYTKKDIDFLATFYDDKCFLISVNDLPSKQKILRLNKPRNNQKVDIAWADDYVAEKVISNYILKKNNDDEQ